MSPRLRGSCDERNGDSRLHAKHATADDDAQSTNDGRHCHAGTTETGCHRPAACRPALHEHTPGFNPQEQLDTYFQQQAGQQGKKVGGLETAQSQIDILFNSQTLQRQANLLYCAISDIEKGIEQSKRLIAAYEKQDLDAMLQLMEERDGNSCDPLPGEMEAMLDNRNKAWVEKMPAIMTEAPTLFVVGAGHLPGDNGVLNLLKQQGYTIEAMK